jgi:hypothetical protein
VGGIADVGRTDHGVEVPGGADAGLVRLRPVQVPLDGGHPAQQVTGQGRHRELRQDAVLPPALGQLAALQQVLGGGGGVEERRPRVSHGRGGG